MWRATAAIVGLLLVATAAVATMMTPPHSHRALEESSQNFRVGKHDQPHRIAYHGSRLPTLLDARGRSRAVRSLLKVSERLGHGDFVWNDDGVPNGDLWIRVDLQSQTMSVFRAGHEIGTAVILFGADEKRTPTGTFEVLEKRRHYHSISYDAPMPFMLRLTNDGVAIHASDVRLGAATHGCIGVPEEFAAKLFQTTRVGTEVSLI